MKKILGQVLLLVMTNPCSQVMAHKAYEPLAVNKNQTRPLGSRGIFPWERPMYHRNDLSKGTKATASPQRQPTQLSAVAPKKGLTVLRDNVSDTKLSKDGKYILTVVAGVPQIKNLHGGLVETLSLGKEFMAHAENKLTGWALNNGPLCGALMEKRTQCLRPVFWPSVDKDPQLLLDNILEDPWNRFVGEAIDISAFSTPQDLEIAGTVLVNKNLDIGTKKVNTVDNKAFFVERFGSKVEDPEFFGSYNTMATALSLDGSTMVGSQLPGTLSEEGKIWSVARGVSIGTAGCKPSRLTTISSDKKLVSGYWKNQGVEEAIFLQWDPATQQYIRQEGPVQVKKHAPSHARKTSSQEKRVEDLLKQQNIVVHDVSCDGTLFLGTQKTASPGMSARTKHVVYSETGRLPSQKFVSGKKRCPKVADR